MRSGARCLSLLLPLIIAFGAMPPAQAASGEMADPEGDTQYAQDITHFSYSNKAKAVIFRLTGPTEATQFQQVYVTVKWGKGKRTFPAHPPGIIFPGEPCAQILSDDGPLVIKVRRKGCLNGAPDTLRFAARTEYNGTVPNPDDEPDPDSYWVDRVGFSEKVARG